MNDHTPATEKKLSSRTMQLEAVRQINIACRKKKIESAEQLAKLAGIAPDRAALVFHAPPGVFPQLPAEPPVGLMPTEWSSLLDSLSLDTEHLVHSSFALSPGMANATERSDILPVKPGTDYKTVLEVFFFSLGGGNKPSPSLAAGV